MNFDEQQEIIMKIQIIKKAAVQTKGFSTCPYLVDPPDGADLKKPGKQ